MRYRVIPAFKTLIPLFAERPFHPVVPLGHRTAGARSEGQGRPLAGARALPLTTASTLAGWRSNGGREIARYAGLLLAGVLAVAACPVAVSAQAAPVTRANPDRKSTRLNQSLMRSSYAALCMKNKNNNQPGSRPIDSAQVCNAVTSRNDDCLILH